MLFSIRRAITRPPIAFGLILLAALTWGAVLLWQSRSSPARRHIDAAVEYTRQGQSRLAEREWLAATRLDPDNPEIWKQLSELYLATNNFPAAIEPTRHILRLAPDT